MEQTNTNEEPKQELSEQERNELTWEGNHEKIANALRYLQQKEIKTTISNIAKVAGLSRKTVYSHLNDHSEKQQSTSMSSVNKLLMDEVIARLCRKATFGDIKAIQLYLELMGAIKRGGNTTNANLINGSNAIMVGGIAFTEKMVQNLSAENLTQLEEFVKAAAQGKPQGVGNKIQG